VGLSCREKLALARLLGRLVSPSSLLSRLGLKPKDNLLTPDVDNLVTWFVDEGVSSAMDEVALAVLPPVRFLLRIVTLDGT
jgi:hypothetical protein